MSLTREKMLTAALEALVSQAQDAMNYLATDADTSDRSDALVEAGVTEASDLIVLLDEAISEVIDQRNLYCKSEEMTVGDWVVNFNPGKVGEYREAS